MLDVAMALASLCLLVAFGAYLFTLTATATRSQQALGEALRNIARVIQRGHAPVGAAAASAQAEATFAAIGAPAAGLRVSVGIMAACTAERVELRLPLPLLPGVMLSGTTTQPLSLTGGCA
ncbi:MAG: hypothetical protein M0000_06680 [Actinomycetota bacterium]|nr:hypothetical protein [Actinomycetota bacterium]